MQKIICFIICLASLCYCDSNGQQMVEPPSNLLHSKWQASWLSCPGVSQKEFGVYHFRKTFMLNEKHRKFVINVSGDNRYILYVNGHRASMGPARGDMNHWNFETIDISSYLTPGKNVLAAVVWNFGEFSPLAQVSHSTAFIVQGSSSLEDVVNTDKSWRVYQNKAYQRPSRRPLQSVVGPGEHVDSRIYPFGWELSDFDDKEWLIPKLNGVGIPYGKFSAWDRMLVPRTIPMMEYKPERMEEVRLADGIEVPKGFLNGNHPVQIPIKSKVTLLIDRGHLTTAYPVIITSGGADSKVKLSYGEAMVDEKGVKGNRNEIAGKRINSDYEDLFISDGGDKRCYQPLWFRTYRYIELTIETGTSPLILHDIYGFFTAYPFEEKATFLSGKPLLDKIWETSWRTARLCAGETYFDCPYYEQLQYIGDTRIQALISLYVSGDDRLMRNAINQFRESSLPEGLTQSRYPSSQPQIIPPFSLVWVTMVHDFWMHRSDSLFVKKQMRGIRQVIEWYDSQVDSTGMLGKMNWWNFVDWSFGPFNVQKPIGGVPPGGITGSSAVLTLQFAYTLQLASQLYKAFGELGQARVHEQQAKRLIQNTFNLCWVDSEYLLADTPAKNIFSQHTNILGILTGAFSQKDKVRVMNTLLRSDKLTPATYYFKFYLHRALEAANMQDLYLNMLGPWDKMLDAGLTTFAETPEPTRSDCHGWSATPIYDFLSLVGGIKPGSAGFKTVNIHPNLGTLNWLKASMPHPLGMIRLSLKKMGNAINGTVELPLGLHGAFEWNGKKINLAGGRQNIDLK